MDVAHSEMVEAELTRMIERRARNGEQDPDERAELWVESVRRYQDREREHNRWEWVRYFDRMAANHAKLSEEYERRASELCEENGRSPTKGEIDAA